jgi:U3 small nucleolar RNA-associated protein 14
VVAVKQDFTQKNLKKVLVSTASPSDLTSGIDINRLKEKYQPNRVNLDLREAIDKNKEIFSVQNDAILENYRDFQANKHQEYEANLPTEQKKLKGWGNWAGPGISEPKVDHALEVKKKLAKIEEIKRKRRDGEMAGVIVREAYNKNVPFLLFS